MNRYAQIVREAHRLNRPTEHAQITDPIPFFEALGQEIQAEVTSRRDEILGPRQTDEMFEDYRLRGYQALATAEELTLTDHPLLQPETEDPASDQESTPNLALVNLAIHTAS